ncbi:pro-glucagon-like [Lepisosteus oculatus]|uniref:pro-glucagon-like n=1 Tax=Lepisosteus oculatus TaxID=7918 RepID=UPI0035F51639
MTGAQSRVAVGLLVLLLSLPSWEILVEDSASETRWHTYKTKRDQEVVSNFKRHSEGTFSSDFTRYLDRIKAKDFVHWLQTGTKRQRYTVQALDTWQ